MAKPLLAGANANPFYEKSFSLPKFFVGKVVGGTKIGNLWKLLE